MNDADELRSLLAAPGATLTKTMQAVDSLESLLPRERAISIGISANVSVDLLSVYLRKHGLLCSTHITVRFGGHDDPLTDTDEFVREGLDSMVFMPFFDNLLPSFEQQIDHLTREQIAAKETDFRARLQLTLAKARTLRHVYLCAFHRFNPLIDAGVQDGVADAIEQFNLALREEAAGFPNVRIIDTDSIVQLVGVEAAFNTRFYLRSTAPYTPAFLDELARRIATSSRGFGSYYFKALVLDCDNTLWGGIVGEDLMQGIKLDPHSYPGKVFWRVQQEFLTLERNGVLLCLCSKNNPADVDEVLEQHPHAVIRNKDLALTKVNWNDKVSNLRALASELNIGLDSLVFVDDSEFECASVRAALPMVRVFRVPSMLSDYPQMARKIRELFLAGGTSRESRSKTTQYRQLQQASQTRAAFATHEDYLASLEMRVGLALNDSASLARIAELTQKSNQFNLTTLRQSPAEIRERMTGDCGAVYSLSVEDRFGSAGLTGVAIVEWRGDTVIVDAFLMSCRVIGRGVEFCIWPTIARDALRQGCKFIEASFRPTAKNAQVADFYDRLGLSLVDDSDGVKHYRASLDAFSPPNTNWIKVSNDQ